MRINIEKIVPTHWNIENINPKQFKVFYETEGRGNSSRPLILPKEVTVDEEFMEAIGMHIGDGKLSPDRFHLDFTSKDMDMIKFMLTFFQKRLNFKIPEMRYTLTYKQLKNDFVSELAKYLKIPENLVHLKQSNRHREPCLGIQLSSTIFRNIFGGIINLILKTDFSDNIVLRRAFLRGLFAAEGSIAISRTENYIVYMAYHLSFEKEQELANFVQRLLEKEGIVVKQILRKSKGEIYLQMTNWQNYLKMWKMDVFRLNARKEYSFMKKLQVTRFSCKVTPGMKERLLNVKYFSHRQIAFLIGIVPATLCHISNNKTEYISVEYLIPLSKIASVPLEEVKQNVVDFRVNDVTPINDKEVMDFIFNLKLA